MASTEVPPELDVTSAAVALMPTPDHASWWRSDHATIYLVDHPGAATGEFSAFVSLLHDEIPTRSLYREGKSWRAEYWSGQQLDGIIRLATTTEIVPGEIELRLFDVLLHGQVLIGHAHVVDWRRKLDESRLCDGARDRLLMLAQQHIELSTAFAESRDWRRAVPCATAALACAIDGYLAGRGYLVPDPAARYQRYADSCARLPADQSIITPDEYWRLMTMRDLGRSDPARWLQSIIRVCLFIIAENNLRGHSELLREIAVRTYAEDEK